jgi:hypothetical protein
MNERIQELADLAEGHADVIVDQGGDFHPAYTEKLAELIVRECAGVELYWLSEQDRKAVAEKIKEHFGVEQ